LREIAKEGDHSTRSLRKRLDTCDALTSVFITPMDAIHAYHTHHRRDLGRPLEATARELGVPFKDVVDLTLRAGLGEEAKAGRCPEPKTIPHAFGFRPGIDLDKLGQLADEPRSRGLRCRPTVITGQD